VSTYGLEFSNLYSRVKDYANINNVVNADTKAKAAINDALRLISVMRYWEQLRRESAITLTASTPAYTIATYAASFDRILSCWYESDSVRYPIEIVDDEKWNAQSDIDSDGIPEICRITKADGTLKIQFSPAPDATFISNYTSIYIEYVKKPTELSGDNDVPEIPDTSQQMAIVYLAVSDLLGKQGDVNGMTAWEMKATRLLNTAHKIDDRKQGRVARLGKPMIPINYGMGSGMPDYSEE